MTQHNSSITSFCPHCRKQNTSQQGEVRCKKCGWEYEIDEDGFVTRGEPVATMCPSCQTGLRVRGAGEATCSACGWRFSVDDTGTVTTGEPDDVACPECGHEVRFCGTSHLLCSACGLSFCVDDEGNVTFREGSETTCPECGHTFRTEGGIESTSAFERLDRKVQKFFRKLDRLF